jgi:hypothetical protein
MNVTFEDSFGKVWSDHHTPNVFTLLTNVPPPHSVHRFAEAHATLTKSLYKKFGEAYLISDFSRVSEEKSEQLCLFYLDLIPQLMKSKISYMAFICPQKSMESLPKEKLMKLGSAPVGIYPSFTEALASINLKRSLHLNHKFVSVL